MAMAVPLSGPSQISANDPPINVIGALNAIPSIKRQTINVAMF